MAIDLSFLGGLPEGLLTPEQMASAQDRAQRAAALQLGLGMISGATGQRGAGKPRLGQIVAQAGGPAMQAYQGAFDQTLRNALVSMQAGQLQKQQQDQARLRSLLPQVFQVERGPETQETYATETGDFTMTKPGDVTGVKIDPAKLQALMMIPGGMEAVRGIAETQKLVRQAGLTAGAQEGESPFAAYLSAQSPEVRKLAGTYDKGFKRGVIDEETALKRIESLGKMEDAFIGRQESKADRELARELAAEERRLAREEGRAERAAAREEKRIEGTEGQRSAAGYAERMVIADNISKQLPASALPTIGTAVAGGVPLIGGYIQRRVMSPEQQLYKQAADDWIRAKLRKESGAVIGEEEMAREYETYFPQPGDTPSVIKQKEQARSTATQAMIKNAGAVFQMPELMPRPVAPAAGVRRYNPSTGRVE